MNTSRTLSALFVFGLVIQAHAITVSISIGRAEECYHPTGTLQASVQGGVGPYQYVWFQGSSSTPYCTSCTDQLLNLYAGTYRVEVTDALGATAMASAGIPQVGSMVQWPVRHFPYLAGTAPVLYVDVYGDYGLNQTWLTATNSTQGQIVYASNDLTYYEWEFALVPGTLSGSVSHTDWAAPACDATTNYTIGAPTVLPTIGVLAIAPSGTSPSGSVNVGLTNGSIPNGIALKIRPAATPDQWSGTQEYSAGSLPAQKLFSGLAAGNYWVVLTGETQSRTIRLPNFNYSCRDSLLVTVPLSAVSLAARVQLSGPYSGAGLMNDGLRSQNLIPLQEPFTASGYVHVGGGGETISNTIVSVTGNNAIVDWVVVELRSAAQPSTRVATRSALLQRDGDVVDINGSSPVSFNVPAGNYYISIGHRMHLSVMSAAPLALSSTVTSIDFTSPSTPTYGTNAQININGVRCLWPGDANGNGTVRYTGTNNDRDLILTAIGGATPTNTVMNTYSRLDINMDGTIRYTGTNNDRDIILETIGGVVPTATRIQQLP